MALHLSQDNTAAGSHEIGELFWPFTCEKQGWFCLCLPSIFPVAAGMERLIGSTELPQ